MSEPIWRRAKQVFHEALDKSGPARERFVAAACGDDSHLRAQVQALLNAHDEAGEFLASPTGPQFDEAARAAAAVEAAGPPEGPGTLIGPYKLLQLIGEGGFGVVYMAEQQEPIRRRVALKIIKLGMDTKEVIARFQAEQQALALMDHPNIAKVFDAGVTESGRPYFVMELVKGVPITEFCDANRLSARERLELFVAVCKAVHHAHEKGIIHRDIKPSNVMVTLHDDTPVPKVIDFGIAKAMNQPLTEKTLFTAYGEFVGTPTYMSPEQAALGGLEIDRRCDIYALGVLLYELLTGTTPMEADSLRSQAFLEIMRMIREDDPPTPSARLDTLGERLAEVARQRRVEPTGLTKLLRGDLDWIVMKALEKDRRRRYDSASELAQDVTRHFSDQPVNARPPSAAYRLRKFARRRRGPVLAAAGIAAAIVVGGTFTPLVRGAPSDGPSLPVIEPRLTRIIGSDTLQIRQPARSPDGRWVAYVAQGSVWIVSSEGGASRRLVDVPDHTEPTWFPGGERIAFFRGGDNDSSGVMTVPFDVRRGQASGQLQRITTGQPGRGFRISPDGRWIAYRQWSDSAGMAIKVIPANGGADRTIYVADGRVFLMDWSADGRYIYFHRGPCCPVPVGGVPGRIFRVAVQGTPPEQILQPPSGPSAPEVPYQVVQASDGPTYPPEFQLQTFDGRPVASIALPQNAGTEDAGRTFAADGRHLLTVVSGGVAAIRLVPVTGRTPRQLGEARAGEWPLGWSSDGSDVFFATPREGRLAIMRTPVTGGAAREVGPLPERGPSSIDNWANPITFSVDGQYLAYSRPIPGQRDRTFVIRPVAGGDEQIVSRALFRHSDFRLAGPGGTPNIAGGDYLYLEHQGDQVQLRATPPAGSSRLIRSFPVADAGVAMGVFGNRVAYAQKGRIFVADGPDGAAKEVAASPNVQAFDDVVWSPDGRWIAASAYIGTRRSYALKVLVVGVTPEGDVFAPARLIDTPIIYAFWGLQWLPDGTAVTVTGQSPPNGRFDIWLVPLQNGGSSVALTSGEQDAIGYKLLSPDGRHVLYRAHIARGSSLWLVDLGDALSRLERR